jgi:hypothetical protein
LGRSPDQRRSHPVPHQVPDVKRAAQLWPRQLDAKVPAGLHGLSRAQYAAGGQRLALAHPFGQIAGAGQRRAGQCGIGELGGDPGGRGVRNSVSQRLMKKSRMLASNRATAARMSRAARAERQWPAAAQMASQTTAATAARATRPARNRAR